MKSTGTAYVFWFLLGAHYLYPGRVGTQLLLWFTMLLGIGLIWWLIDIFRIPGLVAQANRTLLGSSMNTNTNVVNVNIDAATLRAAMQPQPGEQGARQLPAEPDSPSPRA